MRRRALLAASGKIVNHGTIKLDLMRTKLMWEYPLASSLTLTVYLNTGSFVFHAASGSSTNTIALGPGDTILDISIDPQEDSTYIYEIIL